jgi:glycosyltransferase involved in cell wall biosynthesis
VILTEKQSKIRILSDANTLLILVDGDFVGGAETNYRFILPSMREYGWNPIFVCPADRNLRSYFEPVGISICTETGMRSYPPFSVGGRLSVRNLLSVFWAVMRNQQTVRCLARKYSAKAVVSNSMVSHLLIALLPDSGGYRRVVHLHDIVDRNKAMGIYGKGLDWIVRRVDAIVTISDAVIATLPPDARHKTVKLYNPIGEMPDRRRPIESPLRVGMFARYTPWKGHGDLLKIATACSELPIEFVSYGNVSDDNRNYLKELETKAASLKNPDKVKLNHFAPDPLQEMADCDFVLHLSTSPEPFGRVLIEANACGVPLLAYCGGGVEELFENLELNGVRFKNGNWRSIADYLRQVIEQRAKGLNSSVQKGPSVPTRLATLAGGSYSRSFLEVIHG